MICINNIIILGENIIEFHFEKIYIFLKNRECLEIEKRSHYRRKYSDINIISGASASIYSS